MRLAIVSHKECWRAVDENGAPEWYAEGGFPDQIAAIADLFDATELLVPEVAPAGRTGQPIARSIGVVPLRPIRGRGWGRWLRIPAWTATHLRVFQRRIAAADCVHAIVPGDIGTIGLLFARLLGKLLFVRHCGHWGRPFSLADRALQRLMPAMADERRLMFATGHMRPAPPANSRYMHWIFATSLTEREIDALATRREPSSPDAPKLVIACRQVARKGTDRILAALPLVVRTFPGTHLEVIGGGSRLAVSKRLARQLGLEATVRFHGAVSRQRVLEILRSCDLFCYPSTAAEGFPKVLVEAMACGLPFVSSDLPVFEHLAATGAGRAIASLEPASLAEAIADCLCDPLRYSRMSECAVETAKHHSLERWQREIAHVLSSHWGPLKTTERQPASSIR